MHPKNVLLLVSSTLLAVHTVAASDGINFNRDIRPILSDKCFACHGVDKNARKADLRLDDRTNAVETKAIVPGKPDASHLIERIFSTDSESVMPPPKSNKSLSDAQKQLLRKWIEQGAEYQPHWSFIPVPKSVAVPQPNDPQHWIRNPIDAFVLDRLQRERIEYASEATREKWLRRASFDLTGLPPSLADLDTFLKDTADNAYESAVDRLLQSHAYGERMANEWLDVARYADTFGYQADRDTHVWPWRDWVIRAFNDNLAYNDFITWQTAGDLLPKATRDQELATAFNRLHRQTNEGGSIEAEFRQAYIADRVVTNGTAFLGLTFECCRCHNHKYDPLAQTDFYKLAAFFANIDEHGLYSHFTETAPTPAMLLYDGDQESQHHRALDDVRVKLTELHRVRDKVKQDFVVHPLSKDEITVDRVKPAFEPKFRQTFEEAKPAGENKLVPGIIGKAIEFDGDDGFPCQGSGQYGRTTPFTISLWLRPTENKPRVAILHQCVAAEDAAYRGYSLILDNGHLQFSLIHFWPGNAIQVQSKETLPLNTWTHVAISYDGTSTAAGSRIFINGQQAGTDVIRDNLTRDIRYRPEWGDSNSGGVELSLGARFRDVGFRAGAIDELTVYDRQLTRLEIAALGREPMNESPQNNGKPIEASEADRFEHFLMRVNEPYQAAIKDLHQVRSTENELVTRVRQIMVMHELPEPRPMHVLKRGAYDAPGELVTADTPASILPFPADDPRNRLGLAKWLTDDRNPLPSRVAVNRIWNIFFGRGLVASLEDFGGQGQSPTHPELLDWLARDFMDHGWNVKRLCKQIVLSATYRQSTVPRDARLFHDDPDNLLLARASRYRLPAEQLRDNALAVSGLLVRKIGGPSVMPYQPAGLWEEAGTGKSYSQSKGEGLYRRSMYTFWRRTSPPPSMLTFDATSHEVCTARRERTSTPLQALVMLNDPQYVEAARVLAEKCLKESKGDAAESIRTAFRLMTSRTPSAKETDLLSRLYQDQKTHFEANPDSTKAFLSVGDSARDEQLDSAQHAALTVVVQELMNFDECVMKR